MLSIFLCFYGRKSYIKGLWLRVSDLKVFTIAHRFVIRPHRAVIGVRVYASFVEVVKESNLESWYAEGGEGVVEAVRAVKNADWECAALKIWRAGSSVKPADHLPLHSAQALHYRGGSRFRAWVCGLEF